MSLTYKKAGVDIDKGNRFVRAITPLVNRTLRPEVMSGIGPFGAMFRLDMNKYREPVLVSGTDGVGTKLKIAFMAGRHDTVGIDLVAMCVNDVLTCGAEPLFFLDYFATGRLKAGTAVKVVEGIVKGCEQAGCSLIGGETAEMPGFYPDGEYDLSGFSVGVVEKAEVVNTPDLRHGDVLVGLPSSGIHSNGYSLVRKIFLDLKKMDLSTHVPELGCTLGEELLRPTNIYVDAITSLKKQVTIKGMAHITGGGIPGNLVRILPQGYNAIIWKGSWTLPPIFELTRRLGNVANREMQSTFNMGIGYILAVKKQEVDKTLETLRKKGYDSCIIGEVKKGGQGIKYV
jgi:phosphoribosylformylglycinamidine cyclo-ligase